MYLPDLRILGGRLLTLFHNIDCKNRLAHYTYRKIKTSVDLTYTQSKIYAIPTLSESSFTIEIGNVRQTTLQQKRVHDSSCSLHSKGHNQAVRVGIQFLEDHYWKTQVIRKPNLQSQFYSHLLITVRQIILWTSAFSFLKQSQNQCL